jgi:uncharacterized membrane protein YdbT with pleckstrin-like domain
MVSELDYPIQPKWLIKSVVGGLLGWILVLFPLFVYPSASATYHTRINLLPIIIWAAILIVIVVLRRKCFHFGFDEAFLVVKQGVVTRSERHMPYNVIQNVYVEQDYLDRLLGMATVRLENMSYGGLNEDIQKSRFGYKKRQIAWLPPLGIFGNQVVFPGLTPEKAAELKELILLQVKRHPMKKSSGL